MRATLTRLVLAMTALAGCGPAEGLGNYDHKTIAIYPLSNDDGEIDQLTLGIGGLLGGPCPVAGPDLQGTANGVPLTVGDLGENREFEGCSGPALRGPAPSTGPLDIRIWDSTGEIHATFATSFEKRTLELVEPSDGHLFIGDRVELRYAPASDKLVKDANGAAGFGTSYWSTPFERDGDLLSFVVPEVNAYRLGPTTLEMLADVEALNTACEGADSCVLTPWEGPGEVSVTLVQLERNAPSCYECTCRYSDFSLVEKTTEGDDGKLAPTQCSLVQCAETGATRTVVSATCDARNAADVQPGAL
ncbi:MAG: hypothetical protein JWM82_2048 [Myxococcales bacterium]|nr:hypothetical protein [Myxococcales bacterium]